MIVKIQKLNTDAKIPEYVHPGDAGMDLFAVEERVLDPGERSMVPTGVAMHIPEGHVGLVWDKSGRAVKEGLTTMAGVVDAGYRGEINVVVLNMSDETITIEKYHKVAQMLIQPVMSPELEEVDSLDDSSRGEGGFGSTGL